MRMMSSVAQNAQRSGTAGPRNPQEASNAHVIERRIGDLMRGPCKLNDKQVEWIFNYHREHDLRFGEAAVELGLARREDVLWALSQQFHYPYAIDEKQVNPELVIASNPFSDEAEAFRELRSQLMMGVMAPDQPRRALAVVSSNVGDGKTYLAANLAAAFSQLGGPTLFVDADMRTPRSQDVFGITLNRGGLSAMLSGRAEEGLIQRSSQLPSLYVLPCGAIPPNPLELIQRPAFAQLMQEMTAKFDHVIVDTPASTHGADSRAIAAICGAALVVGRRGTTRMKAINSLVASISRSQAKLAGVVMNEY
jgi:chain length determinant protein tyrosine kinase EpsG